MQVVNRGEGMDLLVFLKIAKIVESLKTRDLVPSLTNAQ
jgi:hypothetical protein